MSVKSNICVVSTVLLYGVLISPCAAIKCFDCNSANNSACLDMRSPRMQATIPVVDCAQATPNAISQDFFCRKIMQTILHPDKTAELRITRGCGWVKHKRACYSADNSDHLEMVCQCFGDLCNAATTMTNVKITVGSIVTSLLLMYKNWRENV